MDVDDDEWMNERTRDKIFDFRVARKMNSMIIEKYRLAEEITMNTRRHHHLHLRDFHKKSVPGIDFIEFFGGGCCGNYTQNWRWFHINSGIITRHHDYVMSCYFYGPLLWRWQGVSPPQQLLRSMLFFFTLYLIWRIHSTKILNVVIRGKLCCLRFVLLCCTWDRQRSKLEQVCPSVSPYPVHLRVALNSDGFLLWISKFS